MGLELIDRHSARALLQRVVPLWEQRQRQRESIQRWRPWERSTGPKSAKGKARASRNAWKGDTRRLLRQLAQLLKGG